MACGQLLHDLNAFMIGFVFYGMSVIRNSSMRVQSELLMRLPSFLNVMVMRLIHVASESPHRLPHALIG